jgi:hypothetical protein
VLLELGSVVEIRMAKIMESVIRRLLFLVLVGLLGIVSCYDQRTPINTEENRSKTLPNSSATPILEVVTSASGAAYPKEGDILQMRLFPDGRFEYDDFPDYDPPRFTSRNVVVTRKENILPSFEVDELIALAENVDFLSASERYQSLRRHTDTVWITKVTFKHGNVQKSIALENFWDTQITPELKDRYPNSLVQLLEQIEVLKAKAIGRQSYQWLAKPTNGSQQESHP